MDVVFPIDQTMVKIFIGCVEYSQWFVMDFAKIVVPLTEMMKRDVVVEETPRRREA